MTITLTGDVGLEDVQHIILEHHEDRMKGLELYIPYNSFADILKNIDVQRMMVYMNAEDVYGGAITLYGASVKFYFPELLDEEES